MTRSADPLSPEQRRTLAAVLDVIVPPSPDRDLPGAGEIGVGDDVEANLRDHPALREPLGVGLARLDAQAGDGAPGSFADLDAAGRRAALDGVAAALPAFLGPLVLQTYMAYYRRPQVLEALGLEARPPWPEGYAVPPGDLSLLDPVRRRAPFYRAP